MFIEQQPGAVPTKQKQSWLPESDILEGEGNIKQTIN